MDELERPYHEVANLFPLLQNSDFDELKKDVAENGLVEPILLHPDGSIVDGRNRHRACIETGTEMKFKTWDGEGSLVALVVSLNLRRRHLSSSQRAIVALDMLPMLEKENPHGGDRKSNDFQGGNISTLKGKNRDQAATIVGTNGRYVSDAKRIYEESPELIDRVRDGKMSIPQAKKKMIKEQKAIAKKTIPEDLPDQSDLYNLFCCDIKDLHRHIEPNSVDFIITDPPYPKEYLHTYESLAKLGAMILKPGGSLLAMAGQSYLPDIFSLMCPHIQYNWVVSYLTPGGQSPQIWQRKVNTFWKPVLWFTKGAYVGDWVGDVNKGIPNDNDKRFHEWGQSLSGMTELLERFTYPGQVIVDPFVGGGATAVAAISNHRFFIGSDLSHEAIETTKKRIAQWISK